MSGSTLCCKRFAIIEIYENCTCDLWRSWKLKIEIFLCEFNRFKSWEWHFGIYKYEGLDQRFLSNDGIEYYWLKRTNLTKKLMNSWGTFAKLLGDFWKVGTHYYNSTVKATDILNSTVHSSSSLFCGMIGGISITFKLAACKFSQNGEYAISS